MTAVQVLNNALARTQLTRLRAKNSERSEFRRALRLLTTMLVCEAMREAEVSSVEVFTPMGLAPGARLTRPPLLVPVMRAGLGMLDAALELVGDAPVAFLGMVRNEETLESRNYASTLPANVNGRDALILDPMLATGGTFCHACRLLRDAGAGRVVAMSVLAAPEGIDHLQQSGLADEIFTVAIDKRLNDVGFILPGLGDAGDRQYGTAW